MAVDTSKLTVRSSVDQFIQTYCSVSTLDGQTLNQVNLDRAKVVFLNVSSFFMLFSSPASLIGDLGEALSCCVLDDVIQSSVLTRIFNCTNDILLMPNNLFSSNFHRFPQISYGIECEEKMKEVKLRKPVLATAYNCVTSIRELNRIASQMFAESENLTEAFLTTWLGKNQTGIEDVLQSLNMETVLLLPDSFLDQFYSEYLVKKESLVDSVLFAFKYLASSLSSCLTMQKEAQGCLCLELAPLIAESLIGTFQKIESDEKISRIFVLVDKDFLLSNSPYGNSITESLRSFLAGKEVVCLSRRPDVFSDNRKPENMPEDIVKKVEQFRVFFSVVRQHTMLKQPVRSPEFEKLEANLLFLGVQLWNGILDELSENFGRPPTFEEARKAFCGFVAREQSSLGVISPLLNAVLIFTRNKSQKILGNSPEEVVAGFSELFFTAS